MSDDDQVRALGRRRAALGAEAELKGVEVRIHLYRSGARAVVLFKRYGSHPAFVVGRLSRPLDIGRVEVDGANAAAATRVLLEALIRAL